MYATKEGETYLGAINIDDRSSTKPGNKIEELVRLLSSVKTDSPEAKINETSISDNNGGRILL